MTEEKLPQMTATAIDLLSRPLTLPCGLTLPNRLVKCPMQETLAQAPFFDPPVSKFENLYSQWASAQYGLIITGQVQVDPTYLSIKGDVVCHKDSSKQPHQGKWKRWADIAQREGTPCMVQLAHPGRMSPAGAGNRPADLAPICPSSVPVRLGESWLDKIAVNKVLGTPREMTHKDIDEVVAAFVNGAVVSRMAGFKGCQLHAAHGFLLSQFLSPHTNRREDEYGGNPKRRLALLKRLVTEIRNECPRPYCLSVKLNSADYMAEGYGLSQDEGLEQVRWLADCGEVDFVEISGGNAENKTSKLHNSFGNTPVEKPEKLSASTQIREAYFADFAERVKELNSSVPIQLSGGFRTRTAMASSLLYNHCSLIGLGRTAVLQPTLPRSILLNPTICDMQALATPHSVSGQWLAALIPVKIVGAGLAVEVFYYNMRRLGEGLGSDARIGIVGVAFRNVVDILRNGLVVMARRVIGGP